MGSLIAGDTWDPLLLPAEAAVCINFIFSNDFKPFDKLNKDILIATNCVFGRPDVLLFNGSYNDLAGARSIFFTAQHKKQRHEELKRIKKDYYTNLTKDV
mmetsp:Transcript_26942/g.38651  ORF Transcript_26942/g.38651 Transcript_26942/m.38651 type:complete len:100 (-) Transcript_26942:359-658(-)